MRIITPETDHTAELYILSQLLELPAVHIHLRKPQLCAQDYARYIATFALYDRHRLIAHQHHAVALDLGLSRLHCSGHERLQHSAGGGLPASYASTSTHSWEEFNALLPAFESAFVSPIFPSISKPGYGQGSFAEGAGRENNGTLAVALGGITAARLAAWTRLDFDDVAVCGAVWQAQDPVAEARRCYNNWQLSRLQDR